MSEKNCLIGVISYNNGNNLFKTLSKVKNNFQYKVVINIDGSTDNSDNFLLKSKNKFTILKNKKNRGVGYSIKKLIKFAIKKKFKYLVIIPGNNKNNILEAKKIFNKLINHKFEYVQGSRYLKGSRYDNTPLFRLIMVKLHALMFSILFFTKCTDALEGFRGYDLKIFKNKNININQKWLDKYEFETYLHYKVLKYNIKYSEVAVSKIYPKNKISITNPNGEKYSHIRPIIDWWKIIRPIPLLMLGIKK
jgi:dolichol-phosphate mannosyltransferase